MTILEQQEIEKKYKYFIKKIIWSINGMDSMLNLGYFEYKDLYNAGLNRLISVVDSPNYDKSCYATSIRNGVIDEIRMWLGKARNKYKIDLSLLDKSTIENHEANMEAEQIMSIVGIVLLDFNPRDVDIINMHLDKVKHKIISEVYDVSKKNIACILHKFKKALRYELKQHGIEV